MTLRPATVVAALMLAGCNSSNDTTSPALPELPITHGPFVPIFADTNAAVWFRSEGDEAIQIEWFMDLQPPPSVSGLLQAFPGGDGTISFRLTGLMPDTCYRYELSSLDDSYARSRHRFCTRPGNQDLFTLGLLGDLDFRRSIEAPAIAELATEQPDFLLLVGDWDHRDPTTLEEFRSMHRENRDTRKLAARPLIREFLDRIPVAYTWDDHDYGGNNSDRFAASRELALQAYDEYWPTPPRPNPQAGIWHSHLIGDLVEIFVLDTRSQRDPNSYLDPRFVPDDQPGGNRGELRRDPARSMLDGAALPEGQSTGQKLWLETNLLSTPAQWKIIVSTVTFNATTIKDDAWWDFSAEREELLSFIAANGITGVIVVSADLHTGGGVDDGSNAGLPEISIPSVNLNQTDDGAPSCAIHPTAERTVRTSCGEWTHGYAEHGSGYGVVTVDRNSARIESVNLLGDRFVLELAAR